MIMNGLYFMLTLFMLMVWLNSVREHKVEKNFKTCIFVIAILIFLSSSLIMPFVDINLVDEGIDELIYLIVHFFKEEVNYRYVELDRIIKLGGKQRHKFDYTHFMLTSIIPWSNKKKGVGHYSSKCRSSNNKVNEKTNYVENNRKKEV